MKMILSIILSFTITLAIASGEGAPASPVHSTSISGKILDKDTSEELVCATIEIEEKDMKISTDLEGNFVIKGLDPGTYTLKISYISYKETLIRDFTVEKGESKDLVVNLERI